MHDGEEVRKMFMDRANTFCEKPETTVQNVHRSPILCAALRLSMLDKVMSFVKGKKIGLKRHKKN